MAREKSLVYNGFLLGLPLYNIYLLALARSSLLLVLENIMLLLDINLNNILNITNILVLFRLNIV